MEEMNCSRKENLQELVGDVSRYWVTEGPFGRVRARDKDAECEYQRGGRSHDRGGAGQTRGPVQVLRP